MSKSKSKEGESVLPDHGMRISAVCQGTATEPFSAELKVLL